MKDQYEKTSADGFVLDKKTNTLLVTDDSPYQAIKAARAAKKAQNNLVSDVETIKNDINTLRADIDILMGLFKEVLKKGS